MYITYEQEKQENKQSELKKEDKTITLSELRMIIDEECTCGGAGPGEGCPACEIWHIVFSEQEK